MSAQERKIPAPPVLPDAQPFWDAASEGRLVIKRCADCGEVHYYPRAICPHCLSGNTEWLDTAGEGSLYSFSTMRRGEVAYTVAFVTLDEGITMITNVVDCDPATLQVGQRVHVTFRATDGGPPVPCFSPV